MSDEKKDQPMLSQTTRKMRSREVIQNHAFTPPAPVSEIVQCERVGCACLEVLFDIRDQNARIIELLSADRKIERGALGDTVRLPR